MGDHNLIRLWNLGDVERQIRVARQARDACLCDEQFKSNEFNAQPCWKQARTIIVDIGVKRHLRDEEMCDGCIRRYAAHRRLVTLRRRRAAIITGIERVTRGGMP